MDKNYCIVPWDTKIMDMNVFQINYVPNLKYIELKTIDNKCSAENAGLSFIKVPGNDIDTIHALEKLGFNYIESQYEMHNIMKCKYKIPHYDKLFSISLVENWDTKSLGIICNIAKQTFDTDRYYIDSQVETHVSGERYQNWILDSFNDSNYRLYKYASLKTGDICSFYLVKKEGDITYLALQGVKPSMKGKGIGLSMLIDFFNYYYEIGNKRFYTIISGINDAALNEHIYLGFKIKTQKIVMRKIY